MTKPLPDPDYHRELMLTPFVLIESPLRADDDRQLVYNREYLRACVDHSMLSGEAPFASHGFYPKYLNDEDPFSRKLGIKLGQVVMARASFVAVYADLGVSPGMKDGIKAARKLGLNVIRRKLGAPWKPWREDNG